MVSTLIGTRAKRVLVELYESVSLVSIRVVVHIIEEFCLIDVGIAV